MNGCMNARRPGCRGMLCRGAHASLRRLQVFRFPVDSTGRPDLSGQPESGWVCALMTYRSPSGNGDTEVPGFIGGQQPLYLIAAAGSFDVPLAAGDIVEADGQRWRVSAVSIGHTLTAQLFPEEGE